MAKAIARGTAVAASPKLWMVSDSSATLPESSTTKSCKRAVAISPTNDHFTAQMPRSEVATEGSTAPWVWPCSSWLRSCQCSSPCSCFTVAILPRPVLFTEVRGRGVLRSQDEGSCIAPPIQARQHRLPRPGSEGKYPHVVVPHKDALACIGKV